MEALNSFKRRAVLEDRAEIEDRARAEIMSRGEGLLAEVDHLELALSWYLTQRSHLRESLGRPEFGASESERRTRSKRGFQLDSDFWGFSERHKR